MTRRMWAEQRAKHMRTPAQADADALEELVSLKERVAALKAEHPEWFEAKGLYQFIDCPWPTLSEERSREP